MTAATHDQHLTEAIDRLRAAAHGEKIALNASEGLRTFMIAAAPTRLLVLEATAAVTAEISQLLSDLEPVLMSVIGEDLTPGHVHTAFAFAQEAISCNDPVRRLDLLAYVAILAAELEAIHYRNYVAGGEKDIAFMLAQSSSNSRPTTFETSAVH